MSEPRLISPMLDHYALGGSISEHSGVVCYPAMRQDSEERFIVKTISIPASQVQLEALLLTGAYPTAEAAREYYKDLAKGIRSEIEILDKLAAQRGFFAFADSQIVPMEKGVGYEIYLLSYYRRTLERQLRKTPMTHLSAVNLGIDLCAALALCRKMGYLYVDVKPSNIFIDTAQQSYHLGDLGFVVLDSLKYASLPDRYRSDYTPPEVADAYSTLNTTMDTYALGLCLYQIYNNGALPFASPEEKQAWFASLAQGEPMAPPAYADYEMAEIICKACAYDPAQRWQTPVEMAEALIGYMKRNEVNDVPIIPPVIPVAEPEPVPEPEEPASEENADTAEDAASEDTAADGSASADSADEEKPASGDWIDRMDAILAEDTTREEQSEAPAADEPSLREILENDDHYTPAQEDDSAAEEGSLTDETAKFLNQVQELIDHEAPAPAVAPEPIDVPMPEPIRPEQPEEDPLADIKDSLFQTEDDDDEENETSKDVKQVTDGADVSDLPAPKKGKAGKRILTAIIALLIVGGLAFGCYYFYQNYYLQTIDSISVDGQDDVLTVNVVTDADQSLITVVCKDTYGNVVSAPLADGKATFTQLQPGSQYLISLEISGFHKLVNVTTASYSTPERTQIFDLNAVTGPEDGSVLLSFGVEGPESEEWTLLCTAEGEEDQVFTFSGHSYTAVGLTTGVTYTFTLTGSDDVYLIGESSTTFTVGAAIYAENVAVTGYQDGTMTISWDTPEGVTVGTWIARCYNEQGYDQMLTVTENTATFPEIDPASPYTVEITAEGMSQSARTFITANPVTITNLDASVSGSQINVSWEFQGTAPESGWLVLYTVDGTTEQQIIESDEPNVTIAPAAPGSHYDIVIQSADATSVFNGTTSADVPDITGTFSGNRLTAANITVSLYKAPGDSWRRGDLGNATTTFAPGDNVALVYRTTSIYGLSSESIPTLIVVRDSEGRLAGIQARSRSWDDMWDGGYCEENFTQMPAAPGEYTMTVYVNNAILSQHNITVSE